MGQLHHLQQLCISDIYSRKTPKFSRKRGKSGKNIRQDACYVGCRQIALEKAFICMTCVHTNNHVKAYPYFDGGQDLMLLES